MSRPMTIKSSAVLPANESPAAQRILDIAEQLAQTRGFNGFSYADIASELAVTKASLHYHFATKAALGRALIARYHVAFDSELDAIDRRTKVAPEKLRRYVALYDSVMRRNRMCLCGMLAAEYATLPGPMQDELRTFFDANETWLATVFEEGRRAGDLRFAGSVRQRARAFVTALEGAMLVARAFEDGRRFQSAARLLLSDLTSEQ